MNTRNAFLDELNKMRHDVLAMSAKVEENIGKALAALRTNNAELAREARENDAAVDALQVKIEDAAAIVIATQAPVARDMREMITILKFTSNIERVGDHASHLAKAAIKLSKTGDSPFRAQEHLEKMAETGQEMLRTAVSAFLKQDAQAARDAAALDAKIDEEHKALTEEILKLMKKHPDLVKGAVQILNTSNQMERLGDHITNMCEAVIYMTDGKHEELNE
jgi:phosphate transport system protein